LRHLLPAALLAGLSFGAGLVQRIEIQGNSYVSDSLIIRSLGLSIGQEVNPAALGGGIRTLFELGYFRGVDVLSDSLSPETVGITVVVEENPIVGQVRFENPGDLDVSKAQDSLMIFPGQTLSMGRVAEAEDLVRSMYALKNRHLATVEAVWGEPDPQGRRDLIFRCEQGPDVRVGEIVFQGNEAFTDRELRGRMNTRQDSFWRSGKLKEEEFAQDPGRIEEYYHQNGYPDARVLGSTRELMDDGRHLRITMEVFEGPFRTFGGVGFSGGESIPDSSLTRAVSGIEPGEPYDVREMDKALENLYTLYQDKGYFYAAVQPDVTPGPGDAVDVSFRITEGERAHVRRIDITGNTRTCDNVIRRELTVYPGDLFQRTALLRSMRNIYYLNYFNNVVPDFRPVPESQDVDLIMQVEEKTTGRAGLGAGYSGSDGMSGYLEYGEENFRGRGQSISAAYQFSKSTQNIQLSFTEPWFMDTPLTLGAQLYRTASNYDEYDRLKTGGSILVGRPIPGLDYVRASVRYTLEKVDVFNITTDSTSFYYDLRDTDWPRWESQVRFSFSRDSRDRQNFPGEGSLNSLTLQYAGGPLGGDLGYQKYLLDSQWYVPLWWKFFLTLRARAGYVTGFGGESPPSWEYFELGGTGFYGLRGYGEGTIAASEGYETVGGRSMLIFTAEYRFRIIDQLQLSVFADAGNAWSRWATVDLTDMNRGAGMGVRVEVPMLGILGLDYAYGFDGPDRGWEPHFQIGTSF
jgi:outer membrane protein insertion porin family